MSPTLAPPTPAEQEILAAVRRLDYGEVRVTVCGGNVTQIDETNKRRFPSNLADKR